MLKRLGLALTVAVAAVAALGGGQALANHVRCGDVITRDTTLDSDLIDCPGDGIVIGADDVTLDLDGHTIDGDGDTWGIGVASTDHLGVTVENGTIQEFEHGIHILTRQNPGETRDGGGGWTYQTNGYLGRHVIRRLEVRSNMRNGITIEGSGSDRVEDNWVHSHQGAGISVSGVWPGITSGSMISKNRVSEDGVGIITEMYDGLVRDNVASDNEAGLSVFSVSGRVQRNAAIGNVLGVAINAYDSDIDANTASGNEQDGIRFLNWNNPRGLALNRISRNVASRNGQDGITMGRWEWGSVQAPSPQHNTFDANHVSGNGRHGMYLIGSGGNRLVRNHATRNTASGMYLLFPRFNAIVDNRVADNGESGLVLTGRAPGNEENLIERNSVLRNGGAGISTDGFQNRIQHNATHHNRGDGIVVWNLLENLVQDNSANWNGDDGIDMAEEAPSVVARNSANRNHDLGITVIEGVVDGGGNRAWGNGNPLQCLNILCSAR